MKLQLLLAIAALALLAGCGVPGAPQPPSLELPRRVEDLRAARKGDKVLLTWTTPRETTDRTAIRHPGATLICREMGEAPITECAKPVGTLPAAQTPGAAPANFVDTLPAALQQQEPLGVVSYAVEVENARGRSAGVSNQAEIPLAPALPPPGKLDAAARPDGIELSWPAVNAPSIPGLQFALRIYRGVQGGAAPIVVGEVPATSTAFLDRNFDWEQRYEYHVTPVTQAQQHGQAATVEGDDSPAVQVFAHDVFPPAVPTGVEAVFTPGAPGFIDLTWAPDTDADLAGYDVYRREQGTEPVKINRELVKAPAFRDAEVTAGHTYFYSVSAVDLRGNESARSGETSEKVPQ